jgi:hypothetical protein
MLQVVHPGLNKDAIIDMPNINQCIDIHEYVTKCDAFFKYEKWQDAHMRPVKRWYAFYVV